VEDGGKNIEDMGAMVRVSGRVSFRVEASRVFVSLARSVLAHALEPQQDEVILRNVTILTRYATKLGPLKVLTTEEATIEPGRSITWRHVDGPLAGSVERFEVQVGRGGGTIVHYEGQIRARNSVLRGPLERLFIAPVTRMVSMKALKDAKKSLEGEHWSEAGPPMA
jgi:hypothetical protein